MDDNINVKAFYNYENYKAWCIDQVKNGQMSPDEIVTQDVFSVEEGEDIDDDVNLVTHAHDFHLSLFNIAQENS
jgi:hypothetical protein